MSETSFASSTGLTGLRSPREVASTRPPTNLDAPSRTLIATASIMRGCLGVEPSHEFSDSRVRPKRHRDLNASDSNESTEVFLGWKPMSKIEHMKALKSSTHG